MSHRNRLTLNRTVVPSLGLALVVGGCGEEKPAAVPMTPVATATAVPTATAAPTAPTPAPAARAGPCDTVMSSALLWPFKPGKDRTQLGNRAEASCETLPKAVQRRSPPTFSLAVVIPCRVLSQRE